MTAGRRLVIAIAVLLAALVCLAAQAGAADSSISLPSYQETRLGRAVLRPTGAKAKHAFEAPTRAGGSCDCDGWMGAAPGCSAMDALRECSEALNSTYDPAHECTTPPPFVATKPGTAISRACRTGNSFASDTEVVMADGSRKAISELEVGDRVLATDPETGVTAGREVTAVHLNLDAALADVTVIDADGDVSTINTTQHHPFWNVSDSKWTDVIDLDNGDRLRSSDGSLLTVVSVRSFTGEQWMWDLTVDQIHSFYVAAGDEPVLVHNCYSLDDLDNAIDGLTAAEKQAVLNKQAGQPYVPKDFKSAKKKLDKTEKYNDQRNTGKERGQPNK